MKLPTYLSLLFPLLFLTAFTTPEFKTNFNTPEQDSLSQKWQSIQPLLESRCTYTLKMIRYFKKEDNSSTLELLDLLQHDTTFTPEYMVKVNRYYNQQTVTINSMIATLTKSKKLQDDNSLVLVLIELEENEVKLQPLRKQYNLYCDENGFQEYRLGNLQ